MRAEFNLAGEAIFEEGYPESCVAEHDGCMSMSNRTFFRKTTRLEEISRR